MDLNILAISIGLGLVVSLLFSELFGLASGGLVVPGYIALYLTQPLEVAATLAAALLTFFLVRILSTFVIVYGRRRTALMILVGYAAGILLTTLLNAALESQVVIQTVPGGSGTAYNAIATQAFDTQVIGYIVPGLIAIWLDRQGVIPTLATLFTSAVVVRLILILLIPEALQWFEAGSDIFAAAEEVLAR